MAVMTLQKEITLIREELAETLEESLPNNTEHACRAADEMIVRLAAMLSVQAAELELPDADGWYWFASQEKAGTRWEIVYVTRCGLGGALPHYRRINNLPEPADQPCCECRWVRCIPPPT